MVTRVWSNIIFVLNVECVVRMWMLLYFNGAYVHYFD